MLTGGQYKESLKDGRKVYFEGRLVEDFESEPALAVPLQAIADGFYSYFDSKEAVFTEVAQQVVETMMEGLHTDFVPDLDPVERIRRAMARFVEAFRPNAMMIGLIEQVGTFTPEMRRLRLALRQSFVDRSARGIRRMQADGIADPDLDPVMLAEVLGAMVDQTCYIWFFLGKEFDSHAVVESLTTVWARGIGMGRAAEPR